MEADMFKFTQKVERSEGQTDMNLTEAEYIKKRWQEYTEELHKKDPNHPDNHDDVITRLEP